MGHRSFAHATIARLIHVLWHPAHTFLVHLDARTNHSVAADLRQRFGTSRHPNVHIVGDNHRRPIGWGSFAMVELLLSAIATALAAHPSFDFFINLSDCDVPLRTNREIVMFLRPFRGRSFVATKFPEADAMRYRAHAHMRTRAGPPARASSALATHLSTCTPALPPFCSVRCLPWRSRGGMHNRSGRCVYPGDYDGGACDRGCGYLRAVGRYDCRFPHLRRPA